MDSDTVPGASSFLVQIQQLGAKLCDSDITVQADAVESLEVVGPIAIDTGEDRCPTPYSAVAEEQQQAVQQQMHQTPSTSASTTTLDETRIHKRKGSASDALLKKRQAIIRVGRGAEDGVDDAETQSSDDAMMVDDEVCTMKKRAEELPLMLAAATCNHDNGHDRLDAGDEDFLPEMTEETDNWLSMFQSMSLRDQHHALSHLVASCDMGQIRFLKQIIEPHFQRDFLSCLPLEISMSIVSMLPPRVICRVGAVCRQWRELCDDEKLWRRKCEQEYIEEMPAPSSRFTGLWEVQPGTTRYSQSVLIPAHMTPEEVAANRVSRGQLHGPCYTKSKHKAMFLRQLKITANWKRRRIAGSCVFKGHDDHVITCLQMQGDMIVTGSDDNTLKVWSIEKPVNAIEDSPHLRFTLSGHSGGVWTSQVSSDGRYIVSGSTDRTVRVWDAETGKQLHMLIGHTSTVRCMALVGTILVSGSRDTTLRVWDIVEGRTLLILNGHVAAVRCVQFDGRRVVSGAYDFTVRVWDAETGQCRHSLQGHTNRVYSLLMDAERDLVVSGSLDTTIRVWNIETGACIANLIGHTSLTSGMQLKGDILVSCNADSYIRVWNIRESTCLHRLGGQPNGHSSAITSLQFLDSGLVATSSDDGSVKLWDITKGVFVRDLIRLSSGGSGGCIWRLKATDTLLVCAVGSRNGTEDTKLILLDFDASYP